VRVLHPDTLRALSLLKTAELPEPPPDSGEVPQSDLGSLHREPVYTGPPPIKHPALHAAKAVGGSLLSFGGGMGLGYLANMGIEKALGRPIPARTIRAAAPVLSGLSALAYHTYKEKEREQLHRAIEAHQSNAKRRSLRG